MSNSGSPLTVILGTMLAASLTATVLEEPRGDIELKVPDTLKQHATSGNASDPAQKLVCESAQEWAKKLNASLKDLSKTGKVLEVQLDPAKCAEFLPLQSVDAPQPTGGQ